MLPFLWGKKHIILFYKEMLVSLYFSSFKVYCFILETNECSSMPCRNEGTCVDIVNGFMCECVDGFNGQTCETGKHLLSMAIKVQIRPSMYKCIVMLYIQWGMKGGLVCLS